MKFFLTIYMVLLSVNISATDLLNKIINNHPDVVEARNNLELQEIEKGEYVADNGLQVNFSTEGKTEFDQKNVPVEHVDAKGSYYAGLINLNSNIYDFGAYEFGLDSQDSKVKIARLELTQKFEETLFKLLQKVSRIQSLQIVNDNLSQDLIKANKSLTDIKKRFSGGLGTINEVRDTQLSIVNLEVELSKNIEDYNAIFDSTSKEFQIDYKEIQAIYKFTKLTADQFSNHDLGERLSLTETVKLSPLQNEIYLTQKESLRAEMNSLDALQKPKLDLNLTGKIYGSDSYESFGEVKMTFPLYDSGKHLYQSKKIRKQVNDVSNKIEASVIQKRTNLLDLKKRYEELVKEQSINQTKIPLLEEKLKDVQIKLKLSGGSSLSEELNTYLQLAKTKLDNHLMLYDLMVIKLEYLYLEQELIKRMNLRVN